MKSNVEEMFFIFAYAVIFVIAMSFGIGATLSSKGIQNETKRSVNQKQLMQMATNETYDILLSSAQVIAEIDSHAYDDSVSFYVNGGFVSPSDIISMHENPSQFNHLIVKNALYKKTYRYQNGEITSIEFSAY